MEKFDHTYIGTGPISAIDACIKSKAGAKVLMVDEKAQLGGAWVAINVGHYGRLEIGCHIWSYNKEAYDFLQTYFDLDLIALAPQPFFIKGKTRLIYDHKNGLTTLKNSARYLKQFNFKKLGAYLRHHPAARFPLIPKKYLYPKGGARDLQAAIEKKIAASDIATAMQTKITTLNKVDNGWELHTDEGESYFTQNITLTTTSAVREINYQEKSIQLRHRYLNYTHFHIVVKDELLKPCSYIRVLDDKIIHRISDITYQLETKIDEGYSVILVGVFDAELDKLEVEGSEDEVATKYIVNYLVNKDFLAKNPSLAYTQKNKFETTYIAQEQVDAINALDESINVMATTDLIYGVYFKLKDWETTT
ncbi:MAG: hypothetical protein GQ574_18650 [Crocinitomix sp.]|nr:hypothetical protein [Crocinitomix sp.]